MLKQIYATLRADIVCGRWRRCKTPFAIVCEIMVMVDDDIDANANFFSYLFAFDGDAKYFH